MSEPIQPGTLLTFEDVARFDPDERGELVAGRWIPMTGSTWRHGSIVVRVSGLLASYARAHAGWSVSASDPGARLARNPDTLRCPDVAMVHSRREPTGRGMEGWLDGAPDLAVEVIGDSQSVSELTAKALEYLRAGSSVVWVLDPDLASVVSFTAPDHVRVLGAEEILDGGELLPGFECRVAELFEA